MVTIDTTAPTSTAAINSITTDSGSSSSDFITNDRNGVTVNGTLSTALASGEILEYTNDNGVTFSNVTSSLAGTAISYIDSALTSTNTIGFRVTETVSGNTGTVATQLITIDTTAPTSTIAINSITTDSGSSSSDFITNDSNGLTVNGTLSTGLATGEILEYSNDNGATFTNITSSVSGTAISYIDSALTSTNTIVFRVTESISGNSGTATTQAITIDTTAPTSTVAINSITTDSGSSSSDFITNDSNGVTVNGTLSTGLATGEIL
jgi:hypothetical protein